MGGFERLARRLEQELDVLENKANAASIRVGMAVLSDLVRITPVDTAQAASNWQVGIGAPITLFLPAYVKGKRGSTRAASALQTIAAGRLALQKKRPGQPLYISNVTPYIGELDRGTSTKFAGNFKGRARIVARDALKDTRAAL